MGAVGVSGGSRRRSGCGRRGKSAARRTHLSRHTPPRGHCLERLPGYQNGLKTPTTVRALRLGGAHSQAARASGVHSAVYTSRAAWLFGGVPAIVCLLDIVRNAFADADSGRARAKFALACACDVERRPIAPWSFVSGNKPIEATVSGPLIAHDFLQCGWRSCRGFGSCVRLPIAACWRESWQTRGTSSSCSRRWRVHADRHRNGRFVHADTRGCRPQPAGTTASDVPRSYRPR